MTEVFTPLKASGAPSSERERMNADVTEAAPISALPPRKPFGGKTKRAGLTCKACDSHFPTFVFYEKHRKEGCMAGIPGNEETSARIRTPKKASVKQGAVKRTLDFADTDERGGKPGKKMRTVLLDADDAEVGNKRKGGKKGAKRATVAGRGDGAGHAEMSVVKEDAEAEWDVVMALASLKSWNSDPSYSGQDGSADLLRAADSGLRSTEDRAAANTELFEEKPDASLATRVAAAPKKSEIPQTRLAPAALATARAHEDEAGATPVQSKDLVQLADASCSTIVKEVVQQHPSAAPALRAALGSRGAPTVHAAQLLRLPALLKIPEDLPPTGLGSGPCTPMTGSSGNRAGRYPAEVPHAADADMADSDSEVSGTPATTSRKVPATTVLGRVPSWEGGKYGDGQGSTARGSLSGVVEGASASVPGALPLAVSPAQSLVTGATGEEEYTGFAHGTSPPTPCSTNPPGFAEGTNLPALGFGFTGAGSTHQQSAPLGWGGAARGYGGLSQPRQFSVQATPSQKLWTQGSSVTQENGSQVAAQSLQHQLYTAQLSSQVQQQYAPQLQQQWQPQVQQQQPVQWSQQQGKQQRSQQQGKQHWSQQEGKQQWSQKQGPLQSTLAQGLTGIPEAQSQVLLLPEFQVLSKHWQAVVSTMKQHMGSGGFSLERSEEYRQLAAFLDGLVMQLKRKQNDQQGEGLVISASGSVISRAPVDLELRL